MRDQASTNNLSNKGSQVWSNNAHLVNQVCMEVLAISSKADNTFSESDDVLHVCACDILTHTVFGGIHNASSDTLVIIHNGS